MIYRVTMQFSDGPEYFDFEAADDEAAQRFIDEVLGFCPVCKAACCNRTEPIEFLTV